MFYDVNTDDATLHVPAKSIEDYRNTKPWDRFGNIVPLTDEELGVESLTPAFSQGEGEKVIYDLNGRQMVNAKLRKGIYIVNGKKVMMK